MNYEDLGTFSVEPDVVPAGEVTTVRVQFVVGEAGIGRGGSISVELPDGWHDFGANTAKAVHTESPKHLGYVAAHCSRESAGIVVDVEGGSVHMNKALRTSLDGRTGRFVYVVRVTVTGDDLRAGDTIDVVYGPAASAGFEAGFYAEGPELVMAAVDSAGDGRVHLIEDEKLPSIEIRDRGPSELLAIGPSVLTVGEEGRMRIVALDRYGNLCRGVSDEIEVSADERAIFGEAQQFGQTGSWEVPFTVTSPETLRFRVELSNGVSGRTNPIWCDEDEPDNRLFWGDMHSHSHRSFDGIGRFPFDYARDVSILDFYTLTDHAERWLPGTWERVKKDVIDFYEPGRFVTLLAYEATFGGPYAHHNVFFRGEDGPVVGSDAGTLLDLYEALREGEALVVPHHTGISFSGVAKGGIPGNTQPNPDWSYHNPRLRRLIEIYSAHGQSEYFDVGHPLSYEACRFDYIVSRSVDGPYYAQDAWRQELQLGVVAGSDDHRGQPGRGEYGLTGVWAPELTRDAVFDALVARRVFATTGSRIVVNFSMEGGEMGGRVTYRPSISGEATIIGTDEIEVVDLIKIDTAAGSAGIFQSWQPGRSEFRDIWTDEDPPLRGLYYIRARQERPYRGRAVMAWSSPIWIE